MRLVVPSAARLQNIEAFTRMISESDEPGLEVHLPSTYFFVHPMVLAAIGAAGLRSIKAGVQPVVHGLAPTPSIRYLERMGLFKLLNIDSGIELAAREEIGRFVPLRVVRTGQELTDFIVELAPLFHAENHRHAEPAQYVLSELVRNTIEHAGFGTPSVVAAQVFKRSGAVGIGVADCGRGIRASLSSNYPADTDLEAVHLALRPGVTGTSRRLGGTAENAGAGLFFCKSIALSAQTHMVMHSGSALFKLLLRRAGENLILHDDPGNDRATRYNEMPVWPGTLVGTDINVNAFEEFSGYLAFMRNAYNVDARTAESASRKKRARFA